MSYKNCQKEFFGSSSIYIYQFSEYLSSQQTGLDSNHELEKAAKKRNPKAFGVNSSDSMRKMFARNQDVKNLKQYIPIVNKDPDEPPPIVVAIVGPPKVGKSTLMRSLIKVNYKIMAFWTKLTTNSTLRNRQIVFASVFYRNLIRAHPTDTPE